MQENLGRTYGLVYSQRLLLMLIETGMSREAAYDTVQPLAMTAWRERRSFREIVESAPASRRTSRQRPSPTPSTRRIRSATPTPSSSAWGWAEPLAGLWRQVGARGTAAGKDCQTSALDLFWHVQGARDP